MWLLRVCDGRPKLPTLTLSAVAALAATADYFGSCCLPRRQRVFSLAGEVGVTPCSFVLENHGGPVDGGAVDDVQVDAAVASAGAGGK